ncbi:hypothetical protein LCGC14_0939200 [marine sediment metagenome]|uniref:Uncharacterized protein n=1 Tax=marine sediment metagenome TaxID=412755 RepID=A0A0F9R483_9ZZZZ
MGGPFVRGDAGQSAGGQYTFKPSAVTDGIAQAIPPQCRYFKISAATQLVVQLRLDLVSTTIWAVEGTNIEDVGWLYNSNTVSGLILSFHG